MSLSQWNNDDWIDDELRDLALPEGMLGRLQNLACYSDEAIDSILVDISPPPGYFSRLLRLSEPKRPRWNVRQVSMAASVLLAVGVSYLASLDYFLRAAYSNRRGEVAALDAVLPASDEVVIGPGRIPVKAPLVLSEAELAASPQQGNLVPEVALTSMPSEEAVPSPNLPFAQLGIVGIEPLSSALLSGHDLDLANQVLGSSQNDETSKEPYKVPGLVRRGIEWPKDQGFNLAFLINEGFNPAINLKSAPRLRHSRVPLGISPESYRLTKHYLKNEELPPPDVIRTEEFLASVNYGFPPAPRRNFALHVAGAPSPLHPDRLLNLKLLQIGVQAGGLEELRREPRHLILVVDASNSMTRAGRLENVQSALRKLPGRMNANDRLSLIRFSNQAQVLIEDAGVEHADSILAAIDALIPEGGTSVAAGLQAADRVAVDWAWVPQRLQRVVLISDGLGELDDASASFIKQWTTSPADHAATLSIIDASVDAGLDVAPVRSQFAARQAESANELGWLLEEELTGQSQVIARHAFLTVTFNHKAVAAYRQMGHETTPLTAASKVDLHAGETNVAMYELELDSKGGEDLVAEVRLTWIDPQTNKRTELTRKITRGHFAKTFAAARLPLQLGAMAAETAELLRRSPFREPGYKYETLRQLAAQILPENRDNESYMELFELIKDAEQARPASGSKKPVWNSP